ncbi:hypothetical protein [Acidianus ambivalens]|uniref:hypothetical protein n=1 Tax=Acidianus ambivalens TaxID=2283 RepID=UPI00128ED032|nr:hypothetical protein [Acidianus ambivalens]
MTRIELKNPFVKVLVYIFFFLLKREYLIYKDGDKIVLLRKGRDVDISKVIG